jgi:hypothetical protein
VSFDIPSGNNGTGLSEWASLDKCSVATGKNPIYVIALLGSYGSVIFKNIGDLRSGVKSVVNYNADRVLLYPYNGSNNVTAVVCNTASLYSRTCLISDIFRLLACSSSVSNNLTY